MKTRFGSTWIGLLLVAIMAVALTPGPAFAQSRTFQWEGIVQAINADGSLVVVPTQWGQPAAAPITVGSGNAYLASQLRPGELVMFSVAPEAGGGLIAYGASVEQSHYTPPAPPANSDYSYYGAPGYYGYPYYPYAGFGLDFGFGFPYYYGGSAAFVGRGFEGRGFAGHGFGGGHSGFSGGGHGGFSGGGHSSFSGGGHGGGGHR